MKPHSNFEDEIDGYEGETNWWLLALDALIIIGVAYFAAHLIMWII